MWGARMLGVTRERNAFVPARLWGRHLLALTSLRLSLRVLWEEVEEGVGAGRGGGEVTGMGNRLWVMTIEIFLGRYE